MIIPIRCFTCGKPLAHLYATFKKRVLAGEHPGAVFDSLGVTRYCCRRTLMAHVEWIEDLLVYERRS